MGTFLFFICLMNIAMCHSCDQLQSNQQWVDYDTCTWRCVPGYFRYKAQLLYDACALCDVNSMRLDDQQRCFNFPFYYVPCIKDNNTEATKDGTCLECYNAPPNAIYTSSGTVWNQSSCEWVCNAGYEKSGDGCSLCNDGAYSYNVIKTYTQPIQVVFYANLENI